MGLKSKVCEHTDCDNVLKKTKLISMRQWEARRFCSKSCAQKTRPENMKHCNKVTCKKEGKLIPLSGFMRDKYGKDGRMGMCRDCKRAEQNARYENSRKDGQWIASPDAKIGGFSGFRVGSI